MLLDHQTRPDLRRFVEQVLPTILSRAEPVAGRCALVIAPLGTWIIDLERRTVEPADRAEKADATLRASEDNLAKLLAGKLDGRAARLDGRLRLEGDPSVLRRLSELLSAA